MTCDVFFFCNVNPTSSERADTGQSPIEELSTEKFVKTNRPCLVHTKQILVLWWQNVTATKHTGDKNVSAPKIIGAKPSKPKSGRSALRDAVPYTIEKTL